MTNKPLDFAVIVPLANEAPTLTELTNRLKEQLDNLAGGKVYLVVDDASTDDTLALCRIIEKNDNRFVAVYESQNKNVVDAYLRGYKAAFDNGHTFIIEMDGGLSHDPATLPYFIEAFKNGFDCVYGSRFTAGGAMKDSNFKRRFLSRGGTLLANSLLGTRMSDMTSGYQGFSRDIVKKILDYGLKSKAHFYQTEVRYLLRHKKSTEIAIVYRAPSPSVSTGAITDSLKNLGYYLINRLIFNAKRIS